MKSLLAKILCFLGNSLLLVVLLLLCLLALLALLPGAPRVWAILLLALLCLVGLLVLARHLAAFFRKFCKHLLGPSGSIKNKPGPSKKKIPSHTYQRPDPLLYSQYFLMAQGIAVTWNNPDIQLERQDENDPELFHPVPSNSLAPDTDYRIVARIWNGSQTAPAVGVPVRFSYLTFGIGTVKTLIGESAVDLPVKGADGLPALARIKWRTPAASGHYCIQVEPHWFDDANPANNLGQENVDVKPLNSPRAKFTFPVRNDRDFARELRLEVDTYAIPPLRPCGRDERADWHEMGPAEIGTNHRRLLAEHGRERFPVPEGWTVAVEPDRLRLAPGEEQTVTVDVTAADGFVGTQALNVNALDELRLVGGVTLYVEGTA